MCHPWLLVVVALLVGVETPTGVVAGVVARAESARPRETGRGPGSGVSGTCPDPATTVQQLQARYDTTRAFRARFRQETTVVAVGGSEEARGTVAFKKPGKMRWEFETPERQSIVCDGSTLWIYQPADRQVLKAAFKAAFVSTTPVSFLTGVGRITDDFLPQADPRGCAADRLHVRLVAKAQQDLGSVAFTVDRATFDILEAAVTDPLGNVTTVAFTDTERNVEIPDSEFQFEIPPGVDIIAAPGPGPSP